MGEGADRENSVGAGRNPGSHKSIWVAVSCATVKVSFPLHQNSGLAGHRLQAEPQRGRPELCHLREKSKGGGHRAMNVVPGLRTTSATVLEERPT